MLAEGERDTQTRLRKSERLERILCELALQPHVRIGRLAVSMVKDAGSSTLQFARVLGCAGTACMVETNGLNAAVAFGQSNAPGFVMCPGVRGRHPSRAGVI
jgi:hypothetical protein